MTKKQRQKILGVKVAREFGTTVKGKTFWGRPEDDILYPLDFFGCDQLEHYIETGNLKVIYDEPVVKNETNKVEAAAEIETAEE